MASRRSFCGRSPTLLPWPCSRSDVEHRARKNRLTPCQAGAIARRVGAKAVVPFHFSPRYEECSAALIAEVQAAWSGAPALTRGSPWRRFIYGRPLSVVSRASHSYWHSTPDKSARRHVLSGTRRLLGAGPQGTDQPMVTEALRLAYAQRIADTARLGSDAVRRAFAVVPREKFLGPGPWSILSWTNASGTPGYTLTPDADPAHLYHDIVVAIDASRQLNNGQPSFLAFCLDSLDLKAGERVVHIGCGVGYYTAIIAEVIGPKGHVLGIEIDPKLAMCARDNLSDITQAQIEQADASRLEPADADAILVNAGVTEIKRGWLEALKDGGRMLVPITAQLATTPGVELGRGQILKLVRRRNGFSARFISGVAIYHCVGARDARRDRVLEARFSSGGADMVRSLRVDPHEPNGGCWFHADTFCLSTLEAGLS